MPTKEEQVLRILSETPESLYPSEIADRLNREVGPAGAFTAVEVVRYLQSLGDRVVQLQEGGWSLRRFGEVP
jgi:hypothetical protein